MKHSNVVVIGLFVLGTFGFLFMCRTFSTVKISSLDAEGVTVGASCTGKYASKTKKGACQALPEVPCSPQDRKWTTSCIACFQSFSVIIPRGQCPQYYLSACSNSDGNELDTSEAGTSIETKVLGGCGTRPGNSCTNGQAEAGITLTGTCPHCGKNQRINMPVFSSCSQSITPNNDNHCGDRDSTTEGC